jgi:glutamyl-tRNA synthetase
LNPIGYRGRLAPSPTGYLHVGHARTFWTACEQARANGGTIVLRIEDLDHSRCRPEFLAAIYEDLAWIGCTWQEGPDCGGPFAPYLQSQRQDLYRAALSRLQESGHVYPCYCSRQDVLRALGAPHEGDDEPLYPGTCRPNTDGPPRPIPAGRKPHWRFRVHDGRAVSFVDAHLGPRSFVAGCDFGDFVVWRNDDVPSYQLAVVVDDAAMRITEVVRGEDLLVSTARQRLLYEALGWAPPQFCHCPLVRDEAGVRLAKRHASANLRHLREQGWTPAQIRDGCLEFVPAD